MRHCNINKEDCQDLTELAIGIFWLDMKVHLILSPIMEFILSYDLWFGRSDHFNRENFYIKCQHVIYQLYREFYVEFDDIN